MKKNLIVWLLVFVLILAPSCTTSVTTSISSSTTSSENSEESATTSISSSTTSPEESATTYEEILPKLSFLHINDFLSEKENLLYDGKVHYYTYNDFILLRHYDSLRIGSLELYEKNLNDFWEMSVCLYGSNFILTRHEIWFITEKRQISCFSYAKFFVSETNPSSYITEEGSADIYGITVNRTMELSDLQHQIADIHHETIALTSRKFKYTIIIKENKVIILTKRNQSSSNTLNQVSFPFYFDEITTTNWYHFEDSKEYITFKSSNNTVGVLTFTPMGCTYSIIDADRSEKELVYEDVLTNDGWAIYKKAGNLISSNGKLSFNLENMKYTKEFIGENCALVRGYIDIAVQFKKIDDYFEWESTSIEELLTKYN